MTHATKRHPPRPDKQSCAGESPGWTARSRILGSLAIFAIAGCGGAETPAVIGEPNVGALSSDDARFEGSDDYYDDNSYYDVWTLDVEAGETYTITLSSDDFDTYLFITDGSDVIAFNDDIRSPEPGLEAAEVNLNSRITHTFETGGTYYIYANSQTGGENAPTGPYTLLIERN